MTLTCEQHQCFLYGFLLSGLSEIGMLDGPLMRGSLGHSSGKVFAPEAYASVMKKALDMFYQDCSTALPTWVIRGSFLALAHENPVGILEL